MRTMRFILIVLVAGVCVTVGASKLSRFGGKSSPWRSKFNGVEKSTEKGRER